MSSQKCIVSLHTFMPHASFKNWHISKFTYDNLNFHPKWTIAKKCIYSITIYLSPLHINGYGSHVITGCIHAIFKVSIIYTWIYVSLHVSSQIVCEAFKEKDIHSCIPCIRNRLGKSRGLINVFWMTVCFGIFCFASV